MHQQMAGSTARILSVVPVLALLVLVRGLASAQPRAVTSLVIEQAKLTASDGAFLDYFGHVSISGGTIVVGAHRDDDNGEDSGSAYVFLRFEPVAWVYLPVVLRGAP